MDFSLSMVFTPSAMVYTFPHALSPGSTPGLWPQPVLQGISEQKGWLVSRETADHYEVLNLPTYQPFRRRNSTFTTLGLHRCNPQNYLG
jgi:hypothetical protein